MIAASTIRKAFVSTVIAVAALTAGSAVAAGRDSVFAFGKSVTPATVDVVTARQGRPSVYAADVRTTARNSAQRFKGPQIAGNGRSSVYVRG